MKTSKPTTTKKTRPKTAVPRKALVERRIEGRRFIEFPGVKGRVLAKVELSTIPEYHSLTLYFQDKTVLTLLIEPCFLMASHFSDASSGAERILRRWPTIRSTTHRE